MEPNLDYNKYLVIALNFGLEVALRYLKGHYLENAETNINTSAVDLEQEWQQVQQKFVKTYNNIKQL